MRIGPGGEAVGEDRRADAGAAPVELLADEDPVEARELRASERLGQVQVHQADLVRLGDDVGRMGLVLVALGRARPDLLLGERARERAQLLLLVAEGERDPALHVLSRLWPSERSRNYRLTSQSTSLAGSATPGQAAALRFDDVRVWRWHAASGTRKPILDAISWEVGYGERWALLGPNGAGKTTLLTLAGAVDFPSRGRVEILGETMGRTDVARLRESIGFVDPRAGGRFAPLLTVREVIRTGATATIGYFEERLSGLDIDRADELLGTFGLGGIGERRFGDCSHGERKRALIARALVARPRLLLLDEPGAGPRPPRP